MRVIFIALLVLSAVAAARPAQGQNYVVICTAFGAHYLYDPGTDTCVNVDTGQTKRVTAGGVVNGVTKQQQQILDNAAQIKRNTEGVAMSFALPTAVVDDGKSFGAAVNVGTFAVAVGIGGAFRASDNLTFNGAVAYGVGEGTVGGNAGLNLSW